jgi:hypothetical protein
VTLASPLPLGETHVAADALSTAASTTVGSLSSANAHVIGASNPSPKNVETVDPWLGPALGDTDLNAVRRTYTDVLIFVALESDKG